MATRPPISAKEREAIRKRQGKLDEELLRYEETLRLRELQYSAKAGEAWDRINDNLQREISSLYGKFADENGKLPKNKEFEAARLLALQTQAQFMFNQVTGTEETFKNNAAFTYADSFYFTAFALQQAAPYVAVATPVLTEAAVMGVVANPWLGDGKTYSDRIRANTAGLAAKMVDTLTDATGQGWGVQRTARRIQELTGEGYNDAVRLARTEFTRAASQASSHCFIQNADLLDGKRWNATLDFKTAAKDADNDGEIFPIDYDTPENPGEPGKRIPNHPNCRCKWSPVLASLGPREGERIARGDGDGKDEYGERIYTRARTYKEYAKERGIDLDERLRNDKPSRYLRRGEAPAKGVPSPGAPTATVAAAGVVGAAAAASFADRAREAVGSGVVSVEQAREVGGHIAEEIASSFDERYPTLANAETEALATMTAIGDEYREILKQRETLRRQNPTDPKVKQLDQRALNAYSRYKDAHTKHQDVKKTVAQARAGVVLEKLAEVRSMGSTAEHNFAKGSAAVVKKSLSNAQKFFPTSWLEKSHAKNLLDAKKVKRGYYSSGKEKSELRISGDTDYDLERVAAHELGHRMEDVIPELRKLEKEFYDYRTKGEPLKWLGAPYRKTEKTRFDKFQHPYMGKDYGNKEDSYYEIFTVGFESMFYGTRPLHEDKEYYEFMLGVLAGL